MSNYHKINTIMINNLIISNEILKIEINVYIKRK